MHFESNKKLTKINEDVISSIHGLFNFRPLGILALGTLPNVYIFSSVIHSCLLLGLLTFHSNFQACFICYLLFSTRSDTEITGKYFLYIYPSSKHNLYCWVLLSVSFCLCICIICIIYSNLDVTFTVLQFIATYWLNCWSH